MLKKLKRLFSREKKPTDTRERIYINVVEVFSDSPGGRYEFEGAFSGELFRRKFLYPKLNEAMCGSKILVVNLDGAYGYGCAFLEEAFGGLIREEGELLMEINRHLEIISEEEPGLIEEIQNYMIEAKNV